MISFILDVATLVCTVVLVISFELYILNSKKKIRELSGELDREKARRLSAESELEAMSRRAIGCREPGSGCIGCKHLLIKKNPTGFLPTTEYGCKKNVRCPEFEEEQK